MGIFLIVVAVVVAVGVISYFTNAWFGCQSSNFGPLPPHYRKLKGQFKANSNPAKKKPEDWNWPEDELLKNS